MSFLSRSSIRQAFSLRLTRGYAAKSSSAERIPNIRAKDTSAAAEGEHAELETAVFHVNSYISRKDTFVVSTRYNPGRIELSERTASSNSSTWWRVSFVAMGPFEAESICRWRAWRQGREETAQKGESTAYQGPELHEDTVVQVSNFAIHTRHSQIHVPKDDCFPTCHSVRKSKRRYRVLHIRYSQLNF